MSTVILFREDILAKHVDIIYEIQQKMYQQAKNERNTTNFVGKNIVKKLAKLFVHSLLLVVRSERKEITMIITIWDHPFKTSANFHDF